MTPELLITTLEHSPGSVVEIFAAYPNESLKGDWKYYVNGFIGDPLGYGIDYIDRNVFPKCQTECVMYWLKFTDYDNDFQVHITRPYPDSVWESEPSFNVGFYERKDGKTEKVNGINDVERILCDRIAGWICFRNKKGDSITIFSGGDIQTYTS